MTPSSDVSLAIVGARDIGWECHVRERRRNCEFARGKEAQRLKGSGSRLRVRQPAVRHLDPRETGRTSAKLPAETRRRRHFYGRSFRPRKPEMRTETKRARIGDV